MMAGSTHVFLNFAGTAVFRIDVDASIILTKRLSRSSCHDLIYVHDRRPAGRTRLQSIAALSLAS